jgi:ribosomal protein S18 acetylase RimI-like enzyme
MDITAGCDPTVRPLLVRRAPPTATEHVAALLRDVPVDPQEVADLVRIGTVLVLSDITLPPWTPPVAAAAFRFDPQGRTAELAGIGVLPALRRRGWGRRLLTGALTVLRAEGFERVHVSERPGGAGAALLAAAGFAMDGNVAEVDGPSRFVLLL